MKNSIEQQLTQALKPTLLQISDDSHLHAGHNAAAKAGGTHFSVLVVSDAFRGKTKVERHRMIYKILEDCLKRQVHALAITAMAPEEYNQG